jgi:ABC-2 type transport system ATP-binding protein
VSIEVRGLCKHYRVHKRPPGLAAALRSVFHRTYETVRAVDGIEFSIGTGERVGFLGPNGAGKTTTLKVLAGLLHPSAGEVRVAGFVPAERRDEFLSSIMLVMGQKQQLIWDLPPAETFELNRAIYRVPLERYRKIRSELVELLGIGDLVTKPTRQLSLGERMKCELCASLLHEPKVLFLDEPTIGLDVAMQSNLRTFIRKYNEERGATLLLTSHDMDDVAALCPRVIVIDQGKLSWDGALDALSARIRPHRRVSFRLDRRATDDDLTLLSLRADEGDLVDRSERTLALDVMPAALAAVVARALSTLPVVDLSVENPPLEDVMKAVFRGAAASAASASP